MKLSTSLFAGMFALTSLFGAWSPLTPTAQATTTAPENPTQGGGLPTGISKEKWAQMSAELKAKMSAGTVEREAMLRSAGDTGIDKRLQSLEMLKKRIEQMAHLSANEKTEILNSINAQIKSLTDLKVKISTETGTTTLKADLEAITKSHRVYRLVIPQSAIKASVGRVYTIAGQMEAFGVKVETRIATASSRGKDTTEAQAAYTDFEGKIENAKKYADEAASLVANLTVDQGDSKLAQKNNEALKSAKVKLELAHKELQAARGNIDVMMKASQ